MIHWQLFGKMIGRKMYFVVPKTYVLRWEGIEHSDHGLAMVERRKQRRPQEIACHRDNDLKLQIENTVE